MRWSLRRHQFSDLHHWLEKAMNLIGHLNRIWLGVHHDTRRPDPRGALHPPGRGDTEADGRQVSIIVYSLDMSKLWICYRARVWVGITRSWLGNFPNPLEIAGALDDCMSQAAGEVFIESLNLDQCPLQERTLEALSTSRGTAWAALCWKPTSR